jgi:hypothetical protein
MDKVQGLLRHILGVQQNCLLLGQRLIEAGEFHLGKLLIANGLIHDNSKFHGIEWDHLYTQNDDREKLALAIQQHNRTNPHHPEYWGGINNMPRIYLAEMVCDWKTRSNEFGASLTDWIEDDAMKRFQFTKTDAIYESILFFLELLVEKPFKPVPATES